MTDNHELTPKEQAELAALPRERTAGRLLEERTVKALRARGLLRERHRPLSWLVAGMAASVALFVGGFAAGQWTATREVTTSFAAAHEQTAMRAAQAVQQTGSAYVAALMALARYSDSTKNPGVAEGREAAVAALYAAASELARLAPDSPIARAIASVLADADPQLRGDQTRARNVVWF
jgi:hypothetical protein